jgi:hypothetical protein
MIEDKTKNPEKYKKVKTDSKVAPQTEEDTAEQEIP